MKKRLPPWCKLVKHTLIDKDMDTMTRWRNRDVQERKENA